MTRQPQGAEAFASKSISADDLIRYSGDVKDKKELGEFLSGHVDRDAITKAAAKKKAAAKAEAEANAKKAAGDKDDTEKGKKGKNPGAARAPGCKSMINLSTFHHDFTSFLAPPSDHLLVSSHSGSSSSGQGAR